MDLIDTPSTAVSLLSFGPRWPRLLLHSHAVQARMAEQKMDEGFGDPRTGKLWALWKTAAINKSLRQKDHGAELLIVALGRSVAVSAV